jgi:zinc/manganese transport system permease protein
LTVGWLFEPGLFSSGPVHTAAFVGAVVAIVSGGVGVFTVLRGQSFAGHALADVATAGGSGALFLGLSPLTGFVGGGVIGALAMDLVGVQRVRNRDIATGVVLGGATGLAALFLYLAATTKEINGAPQQILFGSIFTIERSIIPVVLVLGVVTLVVLAVIARPLLLCSISPEAAAARGVSVRLIGSLFIVTLATAVALSALAIGAILSTALLIGPAASALRLTRRIWTAALTAAVLGVATTWLGIVLAYDSFDWASSHPTIPVSFWVVVLIVVTYLLSSLVARVRR